MEIENGKNLHEQPTTSIIYTYFSILYKEKLASTLELFKCDDDFKLERNGPSS